MQVLVTGASGFLGGAIARSLVESGVRVRALRRSHSSGSVADLDIQWVQGDATDRPALMKALKGCEVLFHAAGYFPTVSFDRPSALRKGVNSMRTILQAARDAGVRRVVYTSTITTIGRPPEGRSADERDQYVPGDVDGTYWEVKWAMEQECWRAVTEGQDVVVTNPSICFGPGDVKPTSGAVLLHLARSRLPAFMDGAWNVADVRDVARAHVEAALRGRTGHRYILGGINLTVSMFLHHAAKNLGVSTPKILLPGSIMERAAFAAELAAIVTRRPSVLPIEAVDLIRHGQHFDCAKAKKELGLSERPLDDTLTDTISWFRSAGRLV